MENQEEVKRLEQNFGAGLNQHGYSFQHAVIKLANELYWSEKSLWKAEPFEYPVSINGVSTRIDIILSRLISRFQNIPFFLLAECKRANPSHSNWCFAKAPTTSLGRPDSQLYIEGFYCTQKDSVGISVLRAFSRRQTPYHIALEIKGGDKGDVVGQGKGVIEEATIQVLRGLNGMLELYKKKPLLLGQATTHLFLPVIFTTARLWTTNLDISSAEIRTGNIDIHDLRLEEKPWVIYEYNLSPGIKHSLPTAKTPGNLVDVLEQEYIRSIPIVSASGIEDFLNWSSYIYPQDN